jgi:membrane protease YdiL (CAAX protease family)
MSISARLALGLGALALLLSLAPLGQVLLAVHALEVRELEVASDALLPSASGPGALRLVSAELGVDDEVTFEVCSSSALAPERYGALLGSAILRVTPAGDEEVVRSPLDGTLLAHARRSSAGACIDVGRGVIEVAGTYVTELTWSAALPEDGVRFRARTLACRALGPSDRNLVLAILLLMVAASLVLYVRPLGPIAAERPLRSALAITGAGAATLWVLMQYVTPLLPRGAAWGLGSGVLLALVEVALAFALAGALRLDVLALGHRPADSDSLWMRARPFVLLALAPVFGIALHRVAQIALRVVPSTGEAPIEAFVAWPSGMLSFAALAVVAPLAEEVFFRGMVYGVLAGAPNAARPARVLGAAFGSWLLFALVHLPQTWGSWGGMLAIAIAALGFTLLRVVSGSVLVPALAHLVYNGLLSAEGLLAG